MPFRTTIENLERIDSLIRQRATGTPDQMAEKLEISRATWFRWLEQLTVDLKMPIAYDHVKNTYYYEKKGNLIIKFIEDKNANS